MLNYMNNLLSKLIKNTFVISLVLMFSIFCFGCRDTQTINDGFPTVDLTKQNNVGKWIPGNYKGIEIGKSTRSDLIEKFGKPVWEGEEELEGEEEDVQKEIERNSGKRLLLEFKDVGGMEGKTSILIGEKDKIVQAVVLYPTMPLKKETLISEYGDDFVEKYTNETICAAVETSRQQDSRRNNDDLEMWVFPKIGMYASFNEAGDIYFLGFSLKCRD